jgi:hypothetical protein
MAELFLWIVEVFKVFVQLTIGGVLLYRWYRAERHYYTDMPFLFGLSLLFAAGGESIDAWHDYNGIIPDLFIFRIRTTFATMTLILYLVATVLIWLSERMRVGYSLILIYFAGVQAAVWLPLTQQEIMLWMLPFLFALIIAFIITFFLVWALKRLPDVHGLIMAIGAIIAMIGQGSKTALAAMGIMWVSELIDLLGLTILALGLFIKPGYAKVKTS